MLVFHLNSKFEIPLVKPTWSTLRVADLLDSDDLRVADLLDSGRVWVSAGLLGGSVFLRFAGCDGMGREREREREREGGRVRETRVWGDEGEVAWLRIWELFAGFLHLQGDRVGKGKKGRGDGSDPGRTGWVG